MSGYPILIEPAEGGGFIALVPDLPGCMGDGETEMEALVSVKDAIGEWIDEANRLGRPIPSPSRHVVAA
jgi:antitoxin HicB